MGTESMEDVGTILRSILTSEKSGILLRYLDNEYRTLTGTRIPYRQLGYSTLEEYLHSIPDVVRLSRNAEGNTVVTVVVTESTAHVAEMVRGQKSAKPRPVAKKTYRRPTGPHNAGYRPNYLLSKLTRSRPLPAPSGDKRRPGYELYHPPQHRTTFGTTAKSPQKSYGWSRLADGASNANATRSSFSSYQPQSTYQTPPRFQKPALPSTSGRRSPNKSGDTWSKRSEPVAATTPVTTRQPSTISTFKQPEDKPSSWQELDSSWSKSTFKHSTRSAAEFWEFGAGDSGKQSSTTSQTTAGEASGAGGDAAAAPNIKTASPAVCAEPARPVATATATKSLGWSDRLGSSTTTSMTSAELQKPISTISTVSERPSTLAERKPTVKPDQPRFDPFRQSISLDEIPMPSPEHAAAAAVAAAAAMPSLLPSPTLPSPAPKELGISLGSREPTATMVSPLSPLPSANSSSAPSVKQPLVPAPSGPLSKPRPPEEEEYEKPVRGEHFTVDDMDIPQTPNCLLVHSYARREGIPYSYSTMQDRSKRRKGPPFWLATLRLGERKFPSYPAEKPTQEEAKEAAAARAVSELGLHQSAAVVTHPVTPASTPEEIAVLVRRLTSLVLSKPHGVLKEGVEPLYKQNYSEQLPGNWFEHLVKSNAVHVERGNRCILYPLGGKANSTTSQSAPVQEPVQNGHTISSGSTGSPSSSTGEPSIVTEYVDVFVSCVASTASVCFRFVEYEEEYSKLLEEMAAFFKGGASTRQVVGSPEVAKLYATCHNGRWLRVQPLKNAEKGKVECCFVDEGNSSLIRVDHLWELPEHYTELAHQAIECELDGLVEYADYDGVVDILSELLLGKTLVAEVLQREDPVSVILFDTWGTEDINLNHVVFLSLMTPRLPEKGCVGRCYLCHVTPTGTVWVQVVGPGLETLNNIMTAFNDYCKGTDSMTDDPVTSRMYGCQSRRDNAFFRAVLISPEPLPSGEFKVRHVDCGYEEKAYIAELRNVDSLGDFVLRLPFQAVPCQMRGLTKEDGFYWSADVATQVLSLSGDSHAELLIRVTKAGTDKEEPVVELFRRNKEGQLKSINNTVIETLKQTRCPGLH